MDLKSILTIKQDFSVSIDLKEKADNIYIEIEDEWCGDTESGFGALVGINLNGDQVKKVHDFLGNWLRFRYERR